MSGKDFRIAKTVVTGKTIDDLKHAYKIAAKVVAQLGDKYLPIFERLHEEIKDIEANTHLKALAERINNESKTL